MFPRDHLCPVQPSVQDSLQCDASMFPRDHLCPVQPSVQDSLQGDVSMFASDHLCPAEMTRTACGAMSQCLLGIICVLQP